MEHELTLAVDPLAGRRARRFVADLLTGTRWQASKADAELVVTELVTNAVLHGRGPLQVRLAVSDAVLRLTVADGSRQVPVRPAGLVEGMTGRGLALVDTLTSRWGVRRHQRGKAVWAEMSGDDRPTNANGTSPRRGADEAAPSPPVTPAESSRPVHDDSDSADPDQPEEPRHEVALRDIPTGLLLAAKAHVDNVIRELTLASAGARSGQSGAMSPRVTSIVSALTRFNDARDAIKAQAVAAAAAGRKRTDLVLRLPASAAASGREYLQALDDADAHARAARLLVLEAPPQHRSFRRWYLTCLVEQLDAAEHGDPDPVQPTLEEHLLAELDMVATARRQADRAARLQAVTASLAGAATLADVSEVVVTEAVSALDASVGVLVTTDQEDRPTVSAVIGADEAVLDRLRNAADETQFPSLHTLRTREAVWLESRRECMQRFPALATLEPSTLSLCAVPLEIGSEVTGVLRLSFATQRLFDEDERHFILALAAQGAQTLERRRLYTAEREARHQAEVSSRGLTRLNEVTTALAAATDVTEVADAVSSAAAHSLGATLSALCLLDDDGHTLRVFAVDGAALDIQERWSSFPVEAETPASEAVRTNMPVVVRSQQELEMRYPLIAGEGLPGRVLVAVPLSSGRRRLGSLALRFPPGHVVDKTEMKLLTTIANQCVLALDRATSLAHERDARRNASFLADASSALVASLEPQETIEQLAGLTVPAMADYSVVYLVDSKGDVEAATAAHRDPQLASILVRLQKERPPDPDGDLGRVIRTGESVRYGSVPQSLAERVTVHPELAARAAAMTPASALVVPLKSRGHVLGALALARLEGGAAYTEDDVTLIEQLASRGAVAIDNAQRYERERDTALALQRSLLPQQLPRVDGIRLAWRYLPGTAGTHVGGDWYDVIPVEGGKVALLIGDVMGRGLRAAAVMGQLRAMARAHLTLDVSPAVVLGRLDHALTRLEQEHIATAALGVLDPVDRTLTLASAGHLPPLLVSADGSAEFIQVEAGPPLGTGLGSFSERTMRLPAGSTVLLYTDGLVEDRSLPVDAGMRRLAEAASSAGDPEQLCEVALAALERASGADDDTALLAVGLG